MAIRVGDKIPQFSLHDHEGIELESSDLLGSPFVLYFYPKDDTPGCTKEACAFRDNMAALDALHTVVLGVSPDNATSHAHFIKKYGLDFTLLTDEDLELARKFDAVKEKEDNGKKTLGIERATFVIDATGTIRWMEKPVSVEGHAQRVIEAVKKIVR